MLASMANTLKIKYTIFNALKMMVFALLLCGIVSCSGNVLESDALLAELDKAIENRDAYHKQKVQKLHRLEAEIDVAANDTLRFHAMGHLLDEYISYNSDSALVICNIRMHLAEEVGDKELIIHAALSKAHVYATMGFYKEALDILDNIPNFSIPQNLRLYYFHINRTLYGFLSDYTIVEEDKEKYLAKTDSYRDSLLNENDPNSLYYALIKGDQLNARGKASEAINVLEPFCNSNQITPHDRAIIAITLAQSYHILEDNANLKKQLIISSTNDMISDVNEYISLRELALMLYEEGDIDRAYKYLNICMEDAKESDARLRILEINDIFPIVNKVYLDTIGKQQDRLKWILLLVCSLSLLLLISIFFMYRAKSKLAKARIDVMEVNAQLQKINEALNLSNKQLIEANHSIAENSYLKTEYIARYMDQCSLYIEKLDKTKKQLVKIVNTGNFDDIRKYVKSLSIVDDELKAFYANFDATFLRLFPTFVNDFNSLLLPNERIIPKADGSLTTELRIFALIRLGITDSVKIAQFLRYSVTTIYNYRTRVRNKALGNRDTLEADLMKIGKMQPNCE